MEVLRGLLSYKQTFLVVKKKKKKKVAPVSLQAISALHRVRPGGLLIGAVFLRVIPKAFHKKNLKNCFWKERHLFNSQRSTSLSGTQLCAQPVSQPLEIL